MAEDDIYGSKARYNCFKDNLTLFLKPPSKNNRKTKYYCKNPENLKYFQQLFVHLEAKDLSYVRRLRLLQTMRFVTGSITKNIADCNRKDIDLVMAFMHTTHNSPRSKETFIKNLKYIWRMLFPEKDEKDRPDETIVPYMVRHLSARIDKSRQKLRKDKLSWEEFERIVSYFSTEPRIQAFLTLSLESLARPQELLFRRIEDIEHYGNYGIIRLSDHGKEGTGFLQCIDSYPYLLKWLEVHPLKHDKQAFLFVNTGNVNTCKQLKPKNINKMIRKACKDLNIDKPITCYSLKRNGVTIRRLRGESDMEIQHAARWTSTKQLKTYDLSTQDEALKLALQKRGLIQPDKKAADILKTKACPFCNETVGFAEIICPKCRHTLDRSTVINEQQKDEEIKYLRQSVVDIKSQFASFKQELKQEIQQMSQARNPVTP